LEFLWTITLILYGNTILDYIWEDKIKYILHYRYIKKN